MAIKWNELKTSRIIKGDEKTAYRDPACYYESGTFYLFHTIAQLEDGYMYLYIGLSRSTDLVSWTEPAILTPKDLKRNYSSPGNIFKKDGLYYMCFQTYPLPNQGDTIGDASARLYIASSRDLLTWSEPELIRVKGDVPEEAMGRMIDPYIFEDKDVKGRFYCIYKQNGATLSVTEDLKAYTVLGSLDCGENCCVAVQKDSYYLFNSPHNGINVKTTKDLKGWADLETFYLGQQEWDWAKGRITAGQVLCLKDEPGVGKNLLFFHGSYAQTYAETFGNASLGVAWSDTLTDWLYL